jgi:hypothetical protein
MKAESRLAHRDTPAATIATGLVRSLGGRFSSELGIDVTSGDAREIFKWFLAAILFGARISQTLAMRTYSEFSKHNLLSPQSLIRRGWDGLVKVLDAGGYVRYDFKTATKLLEVSHALIDRYAGNLDQVHRAAADSQDLEQRLKALAKGIGDVTVNIFLRELRGVWQKAEPLPSELVLTAGRDLGFVTRGLKDRKRGLDELKNAWIAAGNRSEEFPDFEAALVRHGLELRRKASRRVVSSASR